MQQTATITSKRQLTIPVGLFRLAGYKEGQQVLVSRMENKLVIEPATNIVDKLAGSVGVPKKFQKLAPEKLVSQAKALHFGKIK